MMVKRCSAADAALRHSAGTVTLRPPDQVERDSFMVIDEERTDCHRSTCGRVRYLLVMSSLERITIDPEVAHGRPVVRGTRVRVADVLALIAGGADEAEILEDYPYLTAEDLKACLAYAAAQANPTK
jgi:uncharacterized protein (DUF433 family)